MPKVLQFIYGKQRGSKGGASRKSYECLGRSTDFPKFLKAHAQPKCFDTGIDNEYDWSSSKIVQAYSVQQVMHTGQNWILVSSLKGLPELKSKNSKQRYTQSLSFALPQVDYTHLLLPELIANVNPEPVAKKNMDMKALRISGRDRRLPKDWKKRVQPFIECLYNGISVNWQDRSVSTEDVVEVFQIVCACIVRE